MFDPLCRCCYFFKAFGSSSAVFRRRFRHKVHAAKVESRGFSPETAFSILIVFT